MWKYARKFRSCVTKVQIHIRSKNPLACKSNFRSAKSIYRLIDYLPMVLSSRDAILISFNEVRCPVNDTLLFYGLDVKTAVVV